MSKSKASKKPAEAGGELYFSTGKMEVICSSETLGLSPTYTTIKSRRWYPS
jgi:hypothetical protein